MQSNDDEVKRKKTVRRRPNETKEKKNVIEIKWEINDDHRPTEHNQTNEWMNVAKLSKTKNISLDFEITKKANERPVVWVRVVASVIEFHF